MTVGVMRRPRQANALDKSISIAATNLFWSKAVYQSSIIFNKLVWHPYPLWKADKKWELKYSTSWVSIDLSKCFEIMGNILIGLVSFI
jgi:hypothetical protein